MQINRLFFICFLCICSTLSIADEDTVAPAMADPEELDAAFQRGLEVPGSPFQLQVNCTDQKGIRSLELFAGGATIWNLRSQVMLTVEARAALLETLISHGFSKFEALYGGNGRPEKTGAAARISCRIQVEIEGLQKRSAQQAGGEQSAAFLGLASSMLDQVEQYERNAVTPTNLLDALEKLNNGQLAPQVLRLRFVDMSGSGSNTTGSILRVRGGEISRQAYSPGRSIASQAWNPLDTGQYQNLVATLQATQLESLPGNLWSDDQLEFEIQVLGYKKVVIARSFSRLDSTAKEPTQQRFDTLTRILRDLGL